MKKGTTTEAAKIIDFEEKKRSFSGMDRFKKMQCSVTLRRLLVHPDGVYFKKGKASRIRDDSKPLMDLESVQSKLRKDLYKKTDQFAADIRMVFCNAMSWYPSRHEVHRTAAKFSDLFETKWKDLEGRWLAEKESKLENEGKKPNSKPLKLNAGEKRKQLSDSDLSIATAEAKLILEKKKANEATQQNRVTMLEQHQKKNFRCCIFRGSMAKLDALSGAIIWQTYMLPDNNGTVGGMQEQPYGVAAPPLMSNRTVPTEHDECVEPENHSDSILALDLDTGKIEWYRQLGGYDVWFYQCNNASIPGCPPSGPTPDADFGEAPMMLSVCVNGTKKDLVAAVQKSGYAWALDRNNGNITWFTG
ncbi:hypothetical protein AHAS_Ahas01G0035600 [Arachis hypogaea]